jgi:predicted amidophosphoribosyltransferase
MDAKKCESCGQEFQEWVEFCPHCGEAIKGFSRPAGFWIRVGAYIIDGLIFIHSGSGSVRILSMV